MNNLTKMIAVAAALCCFLGAMPALAQSDSCVSLNMLIQGNLNPLAGGWQGPVKGLLVDKRNNITPLEGVIYYPFPDGKLPGFTGQVGHETAHPAFNFGSAGKFAAVLDREIAQYSPNVLPHFEFDPANPPAYALGRTMATLKVTPQTYPPEPPFPGWTSSGIFANATGKITMIGTFLVNAPLGFPVIGYWNVEVTGTLCNVGQ